MNQYPGNMKTVFGEKALFPLNFFYIAHCAIVYILFIINCGFHLKGNVVKFPTKY